MAYKDEYEVARLLTKPEIEAQIRGMWEQVESIGYNLHPPVLRALGMKKKLKLGGWFRGPLRAFLWDHLTSAEFLNRGLVHPEFVRQLLKEHDSQRRDNSHWLWMLLMLELWFREWQTARPQLHDQPVLRQI